jgi:O-antigen/teichoic acid export membrane protein
MSLRDQVLRGGAYLAVRQGVGTVVSILGALLLVKALGPAQYGLYAAVAGVFAYLQSVGRWGIDVYLVRRSDDDPEEYDDALTLLLILGLVLAGAALLATPWLERWLRLEGFSALARVMIAGLPLSLVAQVPLARLERALDYRRVALVEVGGQLLYYLVALPLAWRGLGSWAPVAGWWAQLVVMTASYFLFTGYRARPRWRPETIRTMTAYGLSYSASMWIWQLRSLVNPVIVGRFAGADAVGYVALSIRLVELLSFVKTATYRLSVAVLARLQTQPERMRSAVEQGMRFQVLALAPLLVGFGLASPYLLPGAFGARWDAVRHVFPFVALAYLSNAMFNLHSSVLFVLRRNWEVTVFHLAHVATFAGAAGLLVPRLGALGYGWAEVAALWSYLLMHLYLARAVGSPSYWLPMAWAATATLLLFSAYTGWIGAAAAAVMLLLPASRREIVQLPDTLRRLRNAG